MLVPSPYAHRYDLDDGSCAVFHALSLEVVYLGPTARPLFRPLWDRPRPFPEPPGGAGDDPPSYSAPRELQPLRAWLEETGADREQRTATLETLRELHLLQREGDPFDGDLLARLQAMTRHNPTKMLMLVPTPRCNLRCVYCHQREETHSASQMMSLQQVDAILDAWARRARRDPGKKDILIYGGEPLLNPAAVRRIVERIADMPEDELGGEVSVILVTNATLVTPALAAFLAEHDTFVIVSCDGTKQVNDRARLMRDGRGSFDLCDRGFQLLRQAGVRTAVSVTVTRHNADCVGEDFLKVIEHFQPLDIGLNSCLHPPPDRAVNEHACLPLEGTRRMLQAYEGARARGVYVEQFNRRIRPFALRLHRVKDCSSCGGRLVVQPDGRFSFCDSFSFTERYSYPFQGEFDLENNPDYARWCALSPIHWPACHDCPLLALCGGGCRYDAAMASGRLDGLDPHRCTQDREILRWTLQDLGGMVGAAALRGAEILVPSEAARRKLMGELTLDPLTIPLGNANRFGEEVGRGG